MYCNKCGSILPEGSQRCPDCGAVQNVEIKNEQPQQKKGKKKGAVRSFIVSVLAVALVIGVRTGIKELLNAGFNNNDDSDPLRYSFVGKSQNEIENTLDDQKLYVVNYGIDSWEEGSNYGDLLWAEVKNNSDVSLKEIRIAFACWDSAGTTVKVTGNNGNVNDTNIARVSLKHNFIKPGDTYGSDHGYGMHKNSAEVDKFIAIAYYYEDVNGNTWENPYYGAFIEAFEGKSNVSIEMPVVNQEPEYTADELNALLTASPVPVVQSDVKQWTDGDLLCAEFQNNANVTITEVSIVFATFDAQGAPVNITWSDGEVEQTNVARLLLDELSLEQGGKYGASVGLPLHANSDKVDSFVAMVYRYVDAAGNVWESEYLDAWLDIYEVSAAE